MKLQNLAISAGILAVAAIALGWSHKTPEATAASNSTPAAAVAALPGQQDAWVNPEHSSMRAPVVMFLEQKSEDAGVMTFGLRIEVREPLKFSGKLKAQLPNKGQLVEGTLEETVDLSVAGVQYREFKIRPGVLSAGNAFKVTMDGESRTGILGFHAERQFPAKPEIHMPSSNAVQIPGGRPPSALPVQKKH
jgi:hypothetical protein